jgi:hypothetical protein
MAGPDEPVRRETSAGRPRLTDSPWFWLLVFANAALIGLAAIGPKYNRRQAAVERRYEARQEVARRAQNQPAGEAAPAEMQAEEEMPLDDSAHIVPLGPLAVTLVLINSLAIVLFCVSHLRQAAPPAASSHPKIP